MGDLGHSFSRGNPRPLQITTLSNDEYKYLFMNELCEERILSESRIGTLQCYECCLHKDKREPECYSILLLCSCYCKLAPVHFCK